MAIKKTIYISLFTFLGIILSFLVHGAIEIPVINLLVKDFDKYGLGLNWRQWYQVHYVGTIVLFLLGIIAGYLQGKHWWRVIYIERRYANKKIEK